MLGDAGLDGTGKDTIFQHLCMRLDAAENLFSLQMQFLYVLCFLETHITPRICAQLLLYELSVLAWLNLC